MVTNMAVLFVFWDTKMADLASCENSNSFIKLTVHVSTTLQFSEAPSLLVDFKHVFKVTCINVTQRIFLPLCHEHCDYLIRSTHQPTKFLFFVSFFVNLIVLHFSQKYAPFKIMIILALIIVFKANSV